MPSGSRGSVRFRFRLYRSCGLDRPLKHQMGDSGPFELLLPRSLADVGGMGTSASGGVSRLDKNKTSTLTGWPTDSGQATPRTIDRDFDSETDRTDAVHMEREEDRWRGGSKTTSAEAAECHALSNEGAEIAPGSSTHHIPVDCSSAEPPAISNRAVVVFALSTLFWAPVALAVNWLC